MEPKQPTGNSGELEFVAGSNEYSNLLSQQTNEETSNQSEIKFAPEGWMTAHKFAATHGLGPGSVRKAAEAYRSEHPDWYGVYSDRVNRPTEHYHPELARLLRGGACPV